MSEPLISLSTLQAQAHAGNEPSSFYLHSPSCCLLNSSPQTSLCHLIYVSFSKLLLVPLTERWPSVPRGYWQLSLQTALWVPSAFEPFLPLAGITFLLRRRIHNPSALPSSLTCLSSLTPVTELWCETLSSPGVSSLSQGGILFWGSSYKVPGRCVLSSLHKSLSQAALIPGNRMGRGFWQLGGYAVLGVASSLQRFSRTTTQPGLS